MKNKNQKMSWTEKSKFKSYEIAEIFKNDLKESGILHVKIRRRQDGFSVMTGKPTKRPDSHTI